VAALRPQGITDSAEPAVLPAEVAQAVSVRPMPKEDLPRWLWLQGFEAGALAACLPPVDEQPAPLAVHGAAR
jgi:hypothetical protein